MSSFLKSLADALDRVEMLIGDPKNDWNTLSRDEREQKMQEVLNWVKQAQYAKQQLEYGLISIIETEELETYREFFRRLEEDIAKLKQLRE